MSLPLSLRFAPLFLLAAAACGGDESDPVTGDEDNIVPEGADTLFDQAASCDTVLKRHATVRATDLADGSIRWNCGDVAGVTDEDFGQEYCEYSAVSKGKVVKTANDIASGAKLQCVFTGVYLDTKGKDTKLKTAMALAANLGSKVTDTSIVRMLQHQDSGFNSRGAASALIGDCHDNAVPELPKNEVRQAACYQASLVGGTKGTQLKKICRGQDLAVESRWQQAVKLGAKVLTPSLKGYDAQRDIVGCLMTERAQGVTWRNSDPMICGRVTRATRECSCDYNDIPTAVDGFTFTGWTNDSLPTGCRYAKVGGVDYKHLVICDVSQGELEDVEINEEWSNNLEAFCHDRFSTELVMKAPIRLLEKAGTCNASKGKFCSAYTGTTK